MGLGFFAGGAAEGFNQGSRNVSDILTQEKQRQLYGLQAGKLLREQQAGEEIAKLNQQGVLLPNNPPQERLSPNHPIYNGTDLPSTTPQTNTGQGGITYSTTRDNPFLSGGMSDLSIGSTNQQPFQTATQPVAKASVPQFPELDNFDKQIKQFESVANIYNSKGLPDHAKTYMSEAISLKGKKLEYTQKAAESYSKIANDNALSDDTRLEYLNKYGTLLDRIFGDGKTFKPFTEFNEEAKNASKQGYKTIASIIRGDTSLAVGLEDLAKINARSGEKGQKAVKEAMEFMEKAQKLQKPEGKEFTPQYKEVKDPKSPTGWSYQNMLAPNAGLIPNAPPPSSVTSNPNADVQRLNTIENTKSNVYSRAVRYWEVKSGKNSIDPLTGIRNPEWDETMEKKVYDKYQQMLPKQLKDKASESNTPTSPSLATSGAKVYDSLPASGLKTGDKVRGYTFLGGDPANKKNWRK